MKKALFYDPYIDTVGGGERYVFTLVEHLLKNDWQVDVLWNSPEVKEKLKSRFGLELQLVNFIPPSVSFFDKYKLMKKYDSTFWLSDGSVPFMFSKNNILHFQVPFHDINGKSIINKVKFRNINSVVCNSEFTKGFIQEEFGIKTDVVYPPVDIAGFKPGQKENIILYVGRFSQLLQSKRQDVLVNVFKKMTDQGLKDWRLVLAGAIDIGGTEYFNNLKSSVVGYPIELVSNSDFDSIKRLYAKARIFWNASGYEIDEKKSPEKVEHFGITTVESMSAGCVPIVLGKGGQTEIINNGENGLLWYREQDLSEKTLSLIENEIFFNRVAQKAIFRAKDFSKENFCRKMEAIINK